MNTLLEPLRRAVEKAEPDLESGAEVWPPEAFSVGLLSPKERLKRAKEELAKAEAAELKRLHRATQNQK